jgi:membrane protease YdiL (CAAX protease family)
MWLYIVVMYPVGEEVLFRGWIQGWLLRYAPLRTAQGHLSLANVITSVLFVLFHLPHHGWPQAEWVMAPSLVFGYMREYTQGVLSPVALHMIYNLLWNVLQISK